MGEQFRRTGANAPITAPCQFNGGFIITDRMLNMFKRDDGKKDGAGDAKGSTSGAA